MVRFCSWCSFFLLYLVYIFIMFLVSAYAWSLVLFASTITLANHRYNSFLTILRSKEWEDKLHHMFSHNKSHLSLLHHRWPKVNNCLVTFAHLGPKISSCYCLPIALAPDQIHPQFTRMVKETTFCDSKKEWLLQHLEAFLDIFGFIPPSLIVQNMGRCTFFTWI